MRAAIRIIPTQGYQRTTLNEVGKEAGYTGGLVSHRFGSKAGLLKAVITSIGSRFYTDQLGDAIAKPSAEASLNNYIAIYLKEVSVREGHMRNGIAEQIDTSKCPLYLLTGEYDLSATPAMTKELADQVGAQHFEVMKNMGHFPMSENPELFLSYLRPILEKIATQ